jgi:SAM-dependent methyltransferase
MVVKLTMLTTPLENPPSHFSYRDDATIQNVVDRLANDHADLRMLDCGCGDARLAKAMMETGSVDLNRIRYFGFDSDQTLVRSVKSEKEREVFSNYKEFDVRLHDITDPLAYEDRSFDLILVNNIIHEIAAKDIAQVVLKLNKLLTDPKGRLAVIDMEELPLEVCEPWAVPLTADELGKTLRAGGFKPAISRHHKRVWTYRVVIGPISQVNTDGITLALRKILSKKREQQLAVAAKYHACGDISADSQREACRMAAVELAIHQLKGM